MILRKATDRDAVDILQWRNDPVTRAMSRNGGEVGQAAHIAWFTHALQNPAVSIFVGEDGGHKVGMVRFDHEERIVVSININPMCRGRGYGLTLLSDALAQVGGEIWAEIKDDNVASRRIFEQAGFGCVEVEGGFTRYRRAESQPTE